MDLVVVDASVLIAVVTNKTRKEQLVKMTQKVNLIGPRSVHWEIGNAFSAMFKRKRISIEEAIQAVNDYLQIPIRFVDIELEDTLRIAHSLNIYAYDAYLIRSAIKYNSPLLSLDRKLLEKARLAKVQVVEVTL